MNQRKLVLFTLTLLVSACLYVSFTLSKKLQTVIKRILVLESNVHTIKDKEHCTPTMNITDTTNPTLQAYVRDESVSDVDYEPSTDEEEDIQEVSNALLNGVSHSLAGTNTAISAMNTQLQQLQTHLNQSEDNSETERPVQETAPVSVTAVENNAEDSDEEVEYVIEYETVSENEDAEEETNLEDDVAVDNIEQFTVAMSQKHTKNNLISILKEHDLSTYGNKDTLIKRIMTIDNFQQYLRAA